MNEWNARALRVDRDGISVVLEGVEICRLAPRARVERLEPDEKSGWRAVEDADQGAFTYSESGIEGARAWRWRGASSAWAEKEYRLDEDATGFRFSVRVRGSGRVGEIRYFPGSAYEFCEYYVPTCDTFGYERNTYPASMAYKTYFELMVPYMYCYAFRAEGVSARLGLGLIAKKGDYNFVRFDYGVEIASRYSSFYLSTDLEGHTVVDGTWESPAIHSFVGADEFDVVTKYSAYHYESGLCARHDLSSAPRWWYGPIFCGWCEQEALCAPGESQTEKASQAVYQGIADRLRDKGLKPAILIIDDKWQDGYGTARPHPERWPDLRGFVDEMHRRGTRVLLWFKLWGGEGLDRDERMPGDGGRPWNKRDDELYADPSSPKYRARLAETVRFLLSDAPGCMNCDGFKLDYALWMPYGRNAVSHSGEYGVELLKRLFETIYTAAKAAKPDALINASPCHPYFAEVCDQLRLHDYFAPRRNEFEGMSARARLYRIACPSLLIDTDGAGFASGRDTMNYMRRAPELGAPDLYQLSDTPYFSLNEADWAEIRAVWEKYGREMDAAHGAL